MLARLTDRYGEAVFVNPRYISGIVQEAECAKVWLNVGGDCVDVLVQGNSESVGMIVNDAIYEASNHAK
ncbi:hypothetical protein GGR03_002249 [Aurantimonas endophytica]|uniref:Uncharacterized protein n=1 Tax=Aurantimonas endophytica TaxID=1522175 RepID=A0A7W6HDE7_9HYPH|nr:hypothetical protein [Aurantimonas endophytica]